MKACGDKLTNLWGFLIEENCDEKIWKILLVKMLTIQNVTWRVLWWQQSNCRQFPRITKLNGVYFPLETICHFLFNLPPPPRPRPQNFSIEQLNTSIYIIFKVSDPPGARRHGAISTNFFHKINLRNIYGNFTLICPVLTK